MLAKFIGYILLKWVLFYSYQLIESKTEWTWNRPEGNEGLFLAAFMLLSLPILEIILLFFPFYFAIRNRGWLQVILLVIIFSIEFFVGWYTTNQKIEVWMIVKIALSIVLLLTLFKKDLGLNISKLTRQRHAL